MKTAWKLILWLLAIANITVALIMLITANSALSVFNGLQLLSLTPLAFQWILFANLLFIPVWLLFKRRLLFIPAVSIILCWGHISDYCPLHFSASHKSTGNEYIKVLTYNTESFGLKLRGNDTSANNPVTNYIRKSEADIVCLQETPTYYMRTIESENYLPEYPYKSFPHDGGPSVLSKFPILSSEHHQFPNKSGNSFLRCTVKVNNDTIAVYSCHLCSIMLSQKDIDNYHSFVEDPSDSLSYYGSRKVVRKLLTAALNRREHADSLCAVLEQESARYVILAGDFNDPPMSYAYEKVGKFLNDAFSSGGCGRGITYNQNSLNYRIDHIFTSNTLKAHHCWVDTSITASDHNPMIAVLQYNNSIKTNAD